MWRTIVQWLLNTFRNIGDYSNWLTQPMRENLGIGDWKMVTTIPVGFSSAVNTFLDLTPLSLFGITAFSIVIGIWIWHLIWLFS